MLGTCIYYTKIVHGNRQKYWLKALNSPSQNLRRDFSRREFDYHIRRARMRRFQSHGQSTETLLIHRPLHRRYSGERQNKVHIPKDDEKESSKNFFFLYFYKWQRRLCFVQMWDLTTALEAYHASLRSQSATVHAVHNSANASVQTGKVLIFSTQITSLHFRR